MKSWLRDDNIEKSVYIDELLEILKEHGNTFRKLFKMTPPDVA